MKIGNNLFFPLMENNKTNRQTQSGRPTLSNPYGLPPDPRSFRLEGNKLNHQALELTEGDLIFMRLRSCERRYAEAFLNGSDGNEPIGTSSFLQILRNKGVEIPEDARFDISLDKYGKVTISGLDDDALTQKIEEAMSHDSRLINSVLGVFVRSARVLEGFSIDNAYAYSPEQSRLLKIQSDLMEYGVDLRDLSLLNGRIQGLPQELHDKIYGDRSDWLSGMEPKEAEWENWNINRIRDDVIYFLQKGTAHVPPPSLSLTFDSGRMIVNGIGQPNSGGGFDASI